jgi:hypothetical protein
VVFRDRRQRYPPAACGGHAGLVRSEVRVGRDLSPMLAPEHWTPDLDRLATGRAALRVSGQAGLAEREVRAGQQEHHCRAELAAVAARQLPVHERAGDVHALRRGLPAVGALRAGLMDALRAEGYMTTGDLHRGSGIRLAVVAGMGGLAER